MFQAHIYVNRNDQFSIFNRRRYSCAHILSLYTRNVHTHSEGLKFSSRNFSLSFVKRLDWTRLGMRRDASNDFIARKVIPRWFTAMLIGTFGFGAKLAFSYVSSAFAVSRNPITAPRELSFGFDREFFPDRERANFPPFVRKSCPKYTVIFMRQQREFIRTVCLISAIL